MFEQCLLDEWKDGWVLISHGLKKVNKTHCFCSVVNQLKALLRQQAANEGEVSPSRRQKMSPLVSINFCTLTKALVLYVFILWGHFGSAHCRQILSRALLVSSIKRNDLSTVFSG